MEKRHKKVGKAIHYYQKIGVAIIELSGELSTGDEILFVRGGEEIFSQKVESMQIEHKNVSSGEKGDEVGIKIKKAIKAETDVFKIE